MNRNTELRPHMKLLHVGCGDKTIAQTTAGFNNGEWAEIRYDIDTQVNPDITGSMLDMKDVIDGSVDAVFSSHNIEHLYPHQVQIALSEFCRVLKQDGFVIITCPDLVSICELVVKDKLTEPAYTSPAGPIAPIDMIYGFRTAIENGNEYMAHKCGFTQSVIKGCLKSAGFSATVSTRRGHPYYDLWIAGYKIKKNREDLERLAEAHFPIE